MQYQIPEDVLKFSEMAYSAAQASLNDAYDQKLADIRSRLGAKGLTRSSVMDREMARAVAEHIVALMHAKADALMEGYELHSRLNEEAAKHILEHIAAMRNSMLQAEEADLTSKAKAAAWRSRSSSSGLIGEMQQFLREIDRLSSHVVDEIGSNLERRRAFPAKRAAVRPSGSYSYHPEIQRVSGQLFKEGNFRQAVLDAFIQVIHTVRAKTGLPNDGDDLMNRAFSPDGRIPPVRFNTFQSQGEKDEQRGIWLLFKGIVGLRNFKAHVVSTFDNPDRAHEYLALASLLMRLLDGATIDPPITGAPPELKKA